jgi:hypothetical protein
MTAGPWQAARGGAVALAFAALIAGCGGGDGGGRRSDSETSTRASSSRAADATAATTPPSPQPGVLRSLTTWAGAPDPGGAGYRDGKGSAARFTRPTAVAAASDGSYWVVEAARPRKLQRVYTAAASGCDSFQQTVDRLAIDAEGRAVFTTGEKVLRLEAATCAAWRSMARAAWWWSTTRTKT